MEIKKPIKYSTYFSYFKYFTYFTVSICFIFLFILSSSIYASDKQVIITGSVVNVRAGPNISYERIAQVKKDTKVTYLSQQNDWYKVRLPNGKEGWVTSSYAELLPTSGKTNGSDGNEQNIQTNIGVRVNGKTVNFDVPPYINSENRTMVPIRFIGEELGANVNWIPSEKKILIHKQGQEIILWIGKRQAIIDGEIIEMDTQAEIVSDRTMVPLRFISESFGADVQYMQLEKVVVISTRVTQPLPEPGSNGKGSIGLVTGSVVNIRKGPDTSFDVIDQVSRGSFIDILDTQTNWYYVQTQSGVKGWISANYVTIQNIRDHRDSLVSRGTGRVVSFNGNGSYSGYPAITKLEYEEQSEAFFLTIKGNSSLNYSTMSLDNPLRLVIDIEGVKADLPLDELENISIQNPLVNKLRVGQFTDDIVRVVLELTIPVGLEMLNKQGDKELTFLLRKNTIVGKLIVIDPGHGTARTGSSSDPGAIGSTGLMERDVVMDISSKVAAILTGKGANVVLTRNGTSTNLDLDGRINLANSLNADLFISIHANASLNKSMMGSSTYYYAPYSDPFLGSQRAERIRLAQLIQQSLVSHGGRPNLGIIENSFKVIRETNMPSVLVETAFISNATEEKLLADPNFRTKIAEGIAEGIESYFN